MDFETNENSGEQMIFALWGFIFMSKELLMECTRYLENQKIPLSGKPISEIHPYIPMNFIATNYF